jgi:hypothetical protein
VEVVVTALQWLVLVVQGLSFSDTPAQLHTLVVAQSIQLVDMLFICLIHQEL